MLKFKIHTETKSRTPIDVEVEMEFDEETIKAFGNLMKTPEWTRTFASISSTIIPEILKMCVAKFDLGMSRGTTWSGPPPHGVPSQPFPGMPIGPFSSIPPIDPELLMQIIKTGFDSIQRMKKDSGDPHVADILTGTMNPDIFAKDKVEPPGYYHPKQPDNKKIQQTIKKLGKGKEIKIRDVIKDLTSEDKEKKEPDADNK